VKLACAAFLFLGAAFARSDVKLPRTSPNPSPKVCGSWSPECCGNANGKPPTVTNVTAYEIDATEVGAALKWATVKVAKAIHDTSSGSADR
jgi:hypothetical protein